MLLAFLLVIFGVRERGVFVAQTQVKARERSLSSSPSVEALPLEIVQLLDVLARIEARRQVKLRTTRKEMS